MIHVWIQIIAREEPRKLVALVTLKQPNESLSGFSSVISTDSIGSTHFQGLVPFLGSISTAEIVPTDTFHYHYNKLYLPFTS